MSPKILAARPEASVTSDSILCTNAGDERVVGDGQQPDEKEHLFHLVYRTENLRTPKISGLRSRRSEYRNIEPALSVTGFIIVNLQVIPHSREDGRLLHIYD